MVYFSFQWPRVTPKPGFQGHGIFQRRISRNCAFCTIQLQIIHYLASVMCRGRAESLVLNCCSDGIFVSLWTTFRSTVVARYCSTLRYDAKRYDHDNLNIKWIFMDKVKRFASLSAKNIISNKEKSWNFCFRCRMLQLQHASYYDI